MSPNTLADVSAVMRGIDLATLFTVSDGGALAGRPMSNNQEVEYDGDSYFFTDGDTRMVRDIERDDRVALSYQGPAGLIGAKPVFIAVQGRATLVRDTAAFRQHWSKDLDRWFEKGIDTPGLVMIRVRATRIHRWMGSDEMKWSRDQDS